ncbi:MAG: hypothetical protein NXI22_04925 [bacterium]|nr:hypothetical protein [bacterium]
MTWKLAGQTAALSNSELTAKIDLRRTVAGLHELKFGDASLNDWRLLGFDASPGSSAAEPELLQELYSRGDDLIATFAEDPARFVRPQAYWRICGGTNTVAIEFILSMQTSKLDSDPKVQVTSTLTGDAEEPFCIDWQTGAPTGKEFNVVIWRPQHQHWTYAEATYPTDNAGFSANRHHDGIQVTRTMFPTRLEKGVIRRGRIMGLFVPRDNDTDRVASAIQDWVKMPPPLTT